MNRCTLDLSGREPGTGALPVVNAAGARQAWWLDGNPLDPAWSPRKELLGTVPLIVWSGWLGDEPFERDPRAWGGAGAAVLDAAIERWGSLGGSGGPWLLFRPHARHILGDAHRCAKFFERHAAAGIGLALDAPAMLENSMLDSAEDHVTRSFERLGEVSSVVYLAGVRTSADEDGPPRRCGLGDGVLPAALLERLVEKWVRPGVPVIIEQA